jgi:hypothetical protein
VALVGADVALALVRVRARDPSLIDGCTSRLGHAVDGRAADAGASRSEQVPSPGASSSAVVVTFNVAARAGTAVASEMPGETPATVSPVTTLQRSAR